MCGIVGFFNPVRLPEKFGDRTDMDRMVASLVSRGPDDAGRYLDERVYLGHRRLSIIDPEHGQQPMFSVDGRYVITYNGEIFNYVELREELIKSGHTFRTASDTEVLLNLYIKYGREMLDKLNGQFAFAIIDLEDGKAFLARDRIGILPLYYSLLEGTLFFASTLRALLAHRSFPAEIDHTALEQLSCFWSLIGESTFLRNVHALSPGHFVEFDSDGFTKKRYWDIPACSEFEGKSEADWSAEVFDALEEAVRLRLRSDVPVNVYLSGGLDSSIITALSSKSSESGFSTFSINFEDGDFDEAPFQKTISEKFGIENQAKQIFDPDISAVFERVVFSAEQPIYRTAPAPLYHLSSIVRQNNFKVVLTGEGADEVFLGYDIFKEAVIRQELSNESNDKEWIARLSRIYPYLKEFKPRYASLLAGVYQKSSANLDDPLYSHRVRINNGKSLLRFLTNDMRELVNSSSSAEDRMLNELPEDFGGRSLLQRAQYLEIKTYLSGYLLSSQGDRMLMANSIEGRFPFLDHNLIEMVARIPDSLKLRESSEKHILKTAFSEVLPPEITKRTKFPYRAPEARPLVNSDLVDKYLDPVDIKRSGVFDEALVGRLVEKLKTSPGSFSDNTSLVIILSSMIFEKLVKDRFATPNFTCTPTAVN